MIINDSICRGIFIRELIYFWDGMNEKRIRSNAVLTFSSPHKIIMYEINIRKLFDLSLVRNLGNKH